MWRSIRYVLREFSYFSPTLKRGTWILIALIVILQLVLWSFRFYSQQTMLDQEVQVQWLADSTIAASNPKIEYVQHDACMRIDPNTASAETFMRMGFPARVAWRMVHYREKGGKFSSINDICKIYGIDKSLVYRLQDKWIFPQPIPLVERNRKQEEKIELNSADTALLETLSGIGKSLSRRIVKYRDLLGGYYSIEQLREVYGLSTETYQRIYSRLWVDTSKIQKVSISTATFKQLARHPYVGYELARRIDKYRKSGQPLSVDKLMHDSIITSQQADRLQRYYFFPAP